MPQQLISIIIPVYNTEKYLCKCLDSILAQTYTNWEAILVDDGSTDNCGKICDEYVAKDNRFKVIHQENGGVVNARNKGLAIAKGEFLAFVDSDDYIEPTMFEEMLSLAEKDNLDIVWCNLNEIHKDHIEKEIIDITDDIEYNIKKLLRFKLPGYLWNKIIKKCFWDNSQIKTDNKAVICEDTYISMQLFLNNPRMGVVEKELYNYVRYNTSAATRTGEKSLLVRAERNIINIYELLKKNHLLDKYIDDFSQTAMRLKIEMLPFDSKKAIEIFPFTHKNLNNYTLRLPASIYYWLIFNTIFIGKILYRIKFK